MTRTKLSDNALRAQFHKVGLRLTSQRAAIFNVIQDSDGHLDAETIWARANACDQSINLATVYRTLNVFRDMGLIDEGYFARDHNRILYEQSWKPEHYHFTCVGCGETTEFQAEEIQEVGHALEAQYGWKVKHAFYYLDGTCSACRAKEPIQGGGEE